VHTRIVGWDRRWFFQHQHIARAGDGRLCATALMRTTIRDRHGAVPPQRLMKDLGIDVKQVEHLPPHVAAFDQAESALQKAIKDAARRPHSLAGP
jgi:hypothetical protein